MSSGRLDKAPDWSSSRPTLSLLPTRRLPNPFWFRALALGEPILPSIIFVAPMTPASASSTDMKASCTANPGFNRSFQEPFSRNCDEPAALLPAMPNTFSMMSADNPLKKDAAATAPKIPTVLVRICAEFSNEPASHFIPYRHGKHEIFATCALTKKLGLCHCR